jgi:hypothetical protein
MRCWLSGSRSDSEPTSSSRRLLRLAWLHAQRLGRDCSSIAAADGFGIDLLATGSAAAAALRRARGVHLAFLVTPLGST